MPVLCIFVYILSFCLFFLRWHCALSVILNLVGRCCVSLSSLRLRCRLVRGRCRLVPVPRLVVVSSSCSSCSSVRLCVFSCPLGRVALPG